ncbi:MAG: diaminopimelate decarboxylase [Betaproteobacteria bacterium]|nr:diaminopimelate decarboxylase [Betaproteobacteria bacterium]
MNAFAYQHGELHVEDLPLRVIAQRFGTPAYVYSRASILENLAAYQRAFAGVPHLLCYSVKANSNLAVLNLLARQGAGFDIVSGGELARVLAAGGDPGKILFSGVGKSEAEIRLALAQDIHCFNVESAPELERLDALAAAMGRRARVSLRVNPDVDAKTHPYISTGLRENKFGVPFGAALEVYRAARNMAHIELIGLDCHIGSQITELSPYVDAMNRLLLLVDRLAAEGIALRHLDLGGGVGIAYQGEATIDLARYAAAVAPALAARGLGLMLEPGRSIIGGAGILLTRVEYVKRVEGRSFAIVDAAMNDLMRPALYGAYHAIEPVCPRAEANETFQIVGPICESADFLGHDRELALHAGDLLAVRDAGAYGFVMSSNYNTRPRACEVMVNAASSQIVRERETVAQLFAGEHLSAD